MTASSITLGLSLWFVMAARVAAIHVFGAVGQDVDGWAMPSHDGGKAPDVNTAFKRIAVTRARV